MIPMVAKLVTYDRYEGQRCSSWWPRSDPWLTENSRTSSVAAMAKMPSLNASSREVPIAESWHSGRIEGVNERALAFRPWLLGTLLRPVLFGGAVAGGVMPGRPGGLFFRGVARF